MILSVVLRALKQSHTARQTSALQAMPNASWVNANVLVNWQRAIKSAREIEFMRIAAGIVERMHQRIFEVIEPGMRKNDLVAEMLLNHATLKESYAGYRAGTK